MTVIMNPKGVFDDNQKKIIAGLADYTDGHTIYITRGHSSPLGQLRTIEAYARDNKCLMTEFVHDDLHSMTDIWVDGVKKHVYTWQQTHSMLLHLYYTSGEKRGAKINPPFACECLFDYVADGRNKKGEIIKPSPHIKLLDDPKPCPIDASQRIDGQVVDGVMVGGTPDIKTVSEIFNKAKAAGIGIQNVTIEIANGCVHGDTAIV